MDLSIVPEHSFCVLRGLGQRPNKHETDGFRVNGIRLFLQSGYRFALLAAFLLPFVPPFSPLPILQSEQGVLARFSEKCFVRGGFSYISERSVQKKDAGDLHFVCGLLNEFAV